MTNVADLVVAGGVGMAGSLIAWAAKALWSRPREHAAARKDISDAVAQDRESWRADFIENYEAAKERIAEAKDEAKQAKDDAAHARGQCAECLTMLRHTREGIFAFLDEMEHQILTMLAIPNVDPADVRKAARVAIQQMRDTL